MKRWFVVLFLLVWCVGSWSFAGPLINGRLGRRPIPPGGTEILIAPFADNERAVAIISGDGTTALAAYVFDGFGNCVDKKDLSTPGSYDDVAVEWFPSGPDIYTIEIRNAGHDVNLATIALR